MSKVLIVFNHPAPYKVRLFNELTKEVDLTVIFERDNASDRNKCFYEEKEYRFKSIKIKGLKIGKENFISSGIVKHLKNNKYDLIIMNGYSQFAEMKAINYLIRHKIPYVLYINGGIIKRKERKIRRNLKTKFISNASYFMSPDKNSNEFLKYYGADENVIFNYPYSTLYKKEILPTPLSKDEKLLLRKQHTINEEKVFVSCGQLIKRKNYLELVKCWKDFDQKYGLYIAGEGPQRKIIQKYIDDNKMHNVHLVGYMKHFDLFNFYHMCDGFVFPSSEDIYGHVINEAMSQGLPVISTPNVNASKNLIKDGYNGYIVNSILSDDFKNAVASIAGSNLGQNAINTAYENTIELMVKSHVDIFERILKK